MRYYHNFWKIRSVIPSVTATSTRDAGCCLQGFPKLRSEKGYSVQFRCSVMSNSLQPHGLQHARLPCPSPTSNMSFLKLMSIESVMPSNHLILCHPRLLPSSIFPSIRVFSNESGHCIRWPSIRVSASTSVLPMNTQD